MNVETNQNIRREYIEYRLTDIAYKDFMDKAKRTGELTRKGVQKRLSALIEFVLVKQNCNICV